jgi:hypothetical protein
MKFPEEKIQQKFEKGEITFKEAIKQLKNILKKMKNETKRK